MARRAGAVVGAGLLILVCAAAAAAAEEPVDGAAAFAQNCQMCHQAGAVGLAGSYPRLAGRVAAISTKPAGRAYLIDVLTYGMVGTLSVDGQSLTGLMPPFVQVPPEQVAAILSYVQSLGSPPAKHPPPFTTAEVVAGRAQAAKTPGDVLSERHALEKAKIVP
jgi:mono/diheme cytochrome c family protein